MRLHCHLLVGRRRLLTIGIGVLEAKADAIQAQGPRCKA